MAKTKTKKQSSSKPTRRSGAELDSVYILKITLYLILGSQWIHLTNAIGGYSIPLPIGAIIGVALVTHERFQIDRKIEYAVILVSMLIGFWLPMSLSIVF